MSEASVVSEDSVRTIVFKHKAERMESTTKNDYAGHNFKTTSE
jgi:hypothetical protein